MTFFLDHGESEGVEHLSLSVVTVVHTHSLLSDLGVHGVAGCLHPECEQFVSLLLNVIGCQNRSEILLFP